MKSKETLRYKTVGTKTRTYGIPDWTETKKNLCERILAYPRTKRPYDARVQEKHPQACLLAAGYRVYTAENTAPKNEDQVLSQEEVNALLDAVAAESNM